jgi:hypothetical protein
MDEIGVRYWGLGCELGGCIDDCDVLVRSLFVQRRARQDILAMTAN